MMEDNEKVIKAAVNIIVESILNLIQDDPHLWSKRPCSTCRAVSSIIGKPFGCVLKAVKKE
jgi:hypothetical protein